MKHAGPLNEKFVYNDEDISADNVMRWLTWFWEGSLLPSVRTSTAKSPPAADELVSCCTSNPVFKMAQNRCNPAAACCPPAR